MVIKKLIAIMVVFALIAGVAFAETAVSGTIETRLTFVDASSDKDANDDPVPATIGGSVADGYVQLSGQDDDGVIGGLVRIRANEMSPEGDGGGGNFHRAFVWWKPIPQFKAFLGHDLDGLFGTDPLTAWGFHQGGESFLNRHDWDFWRMVFPGNWDGFGLALSVYPVGGVAINLVIPTGLPEWYPGRQGNANATLTWNEVPSSLRLQAEIGIPDIGKVFISWIGPRQEWKDKDDNQNLKLGQIGASFLLTAVDGLQVQLGVSATLKNGDEEAGHSGAFDPNGDDIQYPLAIGLAAHYASGDFGVKFRSAFVLNSVAGFKTTSDTWRYRVHSNNNWEPFTPGTLVTFNVMPWYNLGILRGFLDIGVDIGTPKDADDSQIYFWLNPYIKKGIGPGQINAGIMVGIDQPNPDDDARITFQIPIQFVYSF